MECQNFITINGDNIAREHICCAFSDKKCAEGYELKKRWLKDEFPRGYVFRRLDERAKVFLEYGPAESAWVPVDAPDWLMTGCFWVSGKYKGQGYAKELLESAVEDARRQGRHGLLAIVGMPKFHFLSDPKWLLRQGFVEVDALPTGFRLLALPISPAATAGTAPEPRFAECTRAGECDHKEGLVAYYSNRCPFTEYYVKGELAATAELRGIPLKIIKLETAEQARRCPSPATIFSLFHNGRYLTNDLSVGLEKQFDKKI
ncbi:MAG: GNAT family N-acetyltransferase [Alistipes sp.]|jgi:GNAT superfamily N-acetyltransferase|nr:GNAT family N-acetyltransferase [Alistipes sp.]